MIEHDAAAHRFVQRLDQGIAFLSYEQLGDDVLDLQHTVVPTPARGRGVGDALVTEAMRYAREHGMRVRPSCQFVQQWLGAHPEQDDLIVR
jgi:predicted GNAT family acetyltransferase